MEISPNQTGDSALVIGEQIILLHKASKAGDPAARNVTTGTTDLCFITSEPIDRVMDHIAHCGIDIIEGPVEKIGALGPIESVYIYDPDGNLVEIANYLL